jgi:hypothetical protein
MNMQKIHKCNRLLGMLVFLLFGIAVLQAGSFYGKKG